MEASLETLMRQAQAGDKTAYRQLLHQASRLVRAFLSRRMSQFSAIEDVTQETLLAIHKARHTYSPDRPFKPWLFALANYKLNDHLRSTYRRAAHEEIDSEALLMVADEDVTFQDRIGEQVEEALSELSDRQRLILEKTKIEGYSSREVAEELGMSESAVKVTVHRAVQQLKKKYEGTG